MSTAPPLAGLLDLAGLRERAAVVLAPADESEPPVLVAPVDAVDPPALMLAWEDPWLTFRTPCYWNARLAVVCFAGRLEPDAGVAELEALVAHTINRLGADAYAWPHETTRAPRQLEVAGIPLLSARVIYACPTTMRGT